MKRKTLVVGDPPQQGGHILPFTPSTPSRIGGHQVAIIGGQVFCATCDSIGLIAKAGGPRRMRYITEAALEGDLCVCKCPKPQPLVATLQSTMTYDDVDQSGATWLPLWVPGADQPLAASKLVDEQLQQPSEAQQTQTENICPNMTNQQFATLVMELRDEAVTIVGQRIQELLRWDKVAQERILEWFGDPGIGSRKAHLEDLFHYLAKGMQSMQRVLRGLEPKNFIRWRSGSLEPVGCVDDPGASPQGIAAQVCKPDIKTRTIAIALAFCELRRTNRIYGQDKSRDNDSQLGTLIHEVTHFDDVFGSTDHLYGMAKARILAASSGSDGLVRKNADNIVGYVMGATKQ